MDRQSTAALVVALAAALAVAAGCLGGDAPDEYPPGVSADGVTDADALVAAHEEALSEGSYRVNATIQPKGIPGLERQVMLMSFDADGDYIGRRLVEGRQRAATHEVWHAAGADRMYVARRTSADPERNVTVQAWNDTQPFTFVNWTRAELRSATAAADGPAGTVEGADGNWSVTLWTDDQDRTLRLTVAPDGRIYRVVSDDPDRSYTVTVTRIDGAERPDWVARSDAG